MSIENIWQDENNGQDIDLVTLLQKPKLLNLASHHPLEKLKKNLLINIIWGSLICILYIFIIIHFQIWQVQLSISIVLLFSLWALYTAFLEYKKLNTNVSANTALLQEMKRHNESITTWLITQQKVALIIYPISAAGGFMLGGVIGSGKPVEAFMSKPFVIISLIITVIILVPICYYLAKWMCNYSFGKHLKALQQNIKDLEAEK
jgi:glucan phosphoethanolaminetransferase (alkaline phosphatase superfamily)